MGIAIVAIIVLLVIWLNASNKNTDLQSELGGRTRQRDDALAQLKRAKDEYAELSGLVKRKLDQGIAKKVEEIDAEREAIHASLAEVETKKRNFESELRNKEKQLMEEHYLKASGVYQEARHELAAARREAEDIRFAAHKEAVIAKRMIDTLKRNPESVTIQWIASQFSEFVDAVTEETARWLESKRAPAVQSAAVIREEGAKRRDAERRARTFRLRCEYYEKMFPFLQDAVDDERDSLVEEGYWDGPDSWEKQEDESARWLKRDEYLKMTPAQRAQLALERWTKSRKTAWEAGVEYEDYIGFRYEEKGWKVKYTGMADGRADLGRDLICRKGHTTHIVQCKRWRKDTGILLRENIIFQLLGSTLEYALENKCWLRKLHVGGDPDLLALGFSDEVVPVVVTTAKLSETAEKFAEALGVVVRVVEFDAAFPRIKCNISQNGKIYHLPFDQQYARVRLTRPGEKRVCTVQQAEDEGFRRAMRHFFVSGGGAQTNG